MMMDERNNKVAQWSIAGLFIAGGVSIIAYEMLTRSRMEQTAALFVGLPALVAVVVGLAHMGKNSQKATTAQAISAWIILLIATGIIAFHVLFLHHLQPAVLISVVMPAAAAILLILTVRPRTAVSAIMLVITILILLSGMFLGEGMICILMAAPIFYAVGALVGLAIDSAKKKGKQTITMCVVLVALVPMSSEGVSDLLSFPRDEIVVRERVLPVRSDQVQEHLSRSPQLDVPLPRYLRMGFPRPVSATGEGLAPGSERRIHFAGGEGHPGDLVSVVEKSEPGYVRFRALSDQSKIHHWLEWQSAEVEWRRVDGSRTEVRWTLHYRRLLDPAWYFRPWERYAVGLAADYLIEASAARGAER